MNSDIEIAKKRKIFSKNKPERILFVLAVSLCEMKPKMNSEREKNKFKIKSRANKDVRLKYRYNCEAHFEDYPRLLSLK